MATDLSTSDLSSYGGGDRRYPTEVSLTTETPPKFLHPKRDLTHESSSPLSGDYPVGICRIDVPPVGCRPFLRRSESNWVSPVDDDNRT